MFLTRREFLGQTAKVLAGGVIAASSASAIALKPAQAKEAIVSDKELLGAKLQYAANNLRTAPSKDWYSILVYGESAIDPYTGMVLCSRTTPPKHPGVVMRIDREYLIAHGVDWEPRVGDICPAPLFGIFVD